MEIISVVNQKGGVGKTTTCMNLAASMAALGKKTLIIDLDPQGNASTGLGVPMNDRKNNIYEVIIDECSIKSAIRKTNIKNLDIIPSVVDLSAAELELKEIASREFVLKTKINKLRQYQYIIIDCPPSLGLLTVNALAASKELIIPMQCEFFSLEGLSHLLRTVKLVKRGLNPELEIKGILLTMYDKRNRVSLQVANDVRKYLAGKVFTTIIPRNVRVSEAPSFGMPAIAYDHTCPGAVAYIKLVKEILTNDNRMRQYK
jgi:chromosome partitioning protein